MIYIGNFLHLTNQQNRDEMERRHGEFHLMVAAETVDQALALFKQGSSISALTVLSLKASAPSFSTRSLGSKKSTVRKHLC